MPEVVLAVTRIGFLALLWVFVFVVVGVIRSDLFGSRKTRQPPPMRRPAAPPPPRPAKVKRGRTAKMLVVTEGTLAGTQISLGDLPITIGRANDSTLIITDDYASSKHARISPRDGQWLVEDMGSTNGTYLDRAKVVGPTPVPLGAPIRIGKTVLELRS
ncbi:MAG: FHA domain-containing protein [Actinomycetota bacterium]|nr:FHA domain-containing protein [Actinomycetota bacterium]